MTEVGVKGESEFCKRLVDWADIIRKTFFDGGVEEIISTRRLVHVVRAYGIFKNKARQSKYVSTDSMMRLSKHSWSCTTK